MKENLRVRVGAVVLALATLAAVIFAWLNFVQRSRYDIVDDGVAWTDSSNGIEAWKVAANSPASMAGIRTGDVLLAINDARVPSAAHVARRLYRAGLWTQLRYKLSRNGEEFETRLITTPAQKPLHVENYLRFVGLLYLFIGLFIFIRRWNAPRAVHFYVFCLVSFILYSFQFSGKLDAFDLEVYWSSIIARLLAPALLLHFALVFPERAESSRNSLLKFAAVYTPPLVLLLVHMLAAVNALGFVPTTRSRVALDQLELGFLGLCFLCAGIVFYLSFRRSRSGVLRQQLKWLTGGTLAGSLPFSLLYILPFAFDAATKSWMQFTALSLVLIPLCFGYAIIRYRLMDVDIIFKRGLAYTAATAAVAAIYFALVALIAQIFPLQSSGPVTGMIAIVVAAFLFQPFREGIQARLDRFFYRDRLDYRRTLIEFGSTLTNEVRLEPMLGSVMDRVSQTLLVDRLAIFVEDQQNPGEMRLARSMGVRLSEPLNLSFIAPTRQEFARGPIFFESPRSARDVSESVRRTLEQLDLNYFIPCRIREHTVAVLGLGKTVDGDFLSSDDVELVQTIAGYVAIALDNSQLYSSLEQKALEVARLKDFSENIVESLNVGVLAIDLEGTVEAWNTRMEQLVWRGSQRRGGPPTRRVASRRTRPGNCRARRRGAGHRDLQAPPGAPGQVRGHQRFHHPAGGQVRRTHRPLAAVRRRHPARSHGRAVDPDGEADLPRVARSGRGPRSEYAARGHLQLHPDAREADAGGRSPAHHHRQNRQANVSRQRNRQQSAELFAHRTRGTRRRRSESRGRRNAFARGASA